MLRGSAATRNSGRHLAAGGGIGCWTPTGAWRRHATPLLLVLVLLSARTSTCQGRMLDGRWDWPWPWHPNSTHDGGKGERNQEWVRTLDVLWDRSKDKIGFCLGGSQLKAQRLMVGGGMFAPRASCAAAAAALDAVPVLLLTPAHPMCTL